MIYCHKHCLWFSESKCPKCVAGDEPYLRDRTEVADPNEWKRFKRKGWCK